MYTHNAHPCSEWYIPSKSPILRELLNVEVVIKMVVFRVFLEDGMNLQNNGVGLYMKDGLS